MSEFSRTISLLILTSVNPKYHNSSDICIIAIIINDISDTKIIAIDICFCYIDSRAPVRKGFLITIKLMLVVRFGDLS